MSYNHNDTEAARRLAAYSDFLLAAYGTDADGLADIAGVDRAHMAEYLAADYDNMSVQIIQMLGALTGISYAWLFAEETDGAPVQIAQPPAQPHAIDPDDFDEAVTSVKAAAAMLSALCWQEDIMMLTYGEELLQVLASKLHRAARYLDGVLETL